MNFITWMLSNDETITQYLIWKHKAEFIAYLNKRELCWSATLSQSRVFLGLGGNPEVKKIDRYSSKLGTFYALLYFWCHLFESMEGGTNWKLFLLVHYIINNKSFKNLSLDIIIPWFIILNIYTNKCSISISLSCPWRFSKAQWFHKCNFRGGN